MSTFRLTEETRGVGGVFFDDCLKAALIKALPS